MSYPSSLSDYWHSLQWSSLTASIPTDPRACLSSMTASTFCCLPYLPFWPFSRFADYNDFDVDDNISTSSSTWQPPPSALASCSSHSQSHSSSSPLAASSSSSSSSSSSLYRVSQPVAQPVFSSHLASATFTSPDQLASIIARQDDDDIDDSDVKRGRSDRRADDDRAAHAMTSDMRTSHSKPHQSSSSSGSGSGSSRSKKGARREKGRDREHKKRESREKQRSSNKALNVPRSTLSSSPPSIHQDEDLSDSELSSSDERELTVNGDRHERALMGSVSRPAAIY